MVAGVLFTAGPLSAATPPTSATTPDPCAGSLRSAAGYATAFAGLARSGGGWATADGYVPVALPDGRTAWLMSDVSGVWTIEHRQAWVLDTGPPVLPDRGREVREHFGIEI